MGDGGEYKATIAIPMANQYVLPHESLQCYKVGSRRRKRNTKRQGRSGAETPLPFVCGRTRRHCHANEEAPAHLSKGQSYLCTLRIHVAIMPNNSDSHIEQREAHDSLDQKGKEEA